MPDPNRAGSAILVRANGKDFLFDCGRGVLMRAAAVDSGAPFLAALFFTHMHSDHTTDYNDVITTRWIMSPKPNPLTVYGPVGVEEFTRKTLAALEFDIGYRLDHHDDLTDAPQVDATELDPGTTVEFDSVKITAAETDHSPVHPTLGYRVEANGKIVAIAGDTIPCTGLDAICRDADIYVQTATRHDIIAKSPSERLRDTLDYHSSIEQAGETAARCNVKTLILNHLVPPPRPGREAEYIDRAARHFDGKIHLADDLLRVGC